MRPSTDVRSDIDLNVVQGPRLVVDDEGGRTGVSADWTHTRSGATWNEIVAIGLVAGDLTVPGLVRYAGVSTAAATRALDEAVAEGVLTPDHEPVDSADELILALSPDDVASVHAAAALHLMREGPGHVDAVVEHARAASSVDQSELARLAATSGRLALAGGDQTVAEQMLRIAIELTGTEPDVERARLLLDLARATRSLGRIGEARDLLSEVVAIAELAGDADLVVDAAVGSAFPPDWRAGDRRTAALLDLADRMDDGGRSAAILAARAMVEMRIPVSSDPDQQIAWVTRSTVAQPLADTALDLSHGRRDRDRLIALVGWRSTHRSPEFLSRRIDVSREAVDLSQLLLDHDRLADSAASLAVDCLEAGDRAGHERSVATLRWAAETDGNPRLRWWAETVAAGSALIDGDVETALRHRGAAFEIGSDHDLPGWVAAEILLAAEIVLDTDDLDELATFLLPTDDAVLDSPIARSTVAVMAARLGDVERARAEVRTVRRRLDAESSYLLCLTLLARATSLSDDVEMAGELRDLLEPWRGHVAVDSSGWWCHGPVDLALAELALVAAGPTSADELLRDADATVRTLGDVRSASRIARVRAAVSDGTPAAAAAPPRRPPAAIPGLAELSERELDVLRLIARGSTNAAIGEELAFSASTIRADTVSIYRKLGVRGRAEAAAVAVTAGLTDPTT